MSQLTKAQNVFTNFKDTVVYDDFTYDQKTFPQKYNTQEISTIDNSTYRVKRMSPDGKSIIYLNYTNELATYEASIDIELVKSKEIPSGGLVVHGQTTRNGAIFIEINCNKQFRVLKQSGESFRLLSGSPNQSGWIKSKSLRKKGTNNITTRVSKGYIDIYFNDIYTYTSYDLEFQDGKLGLFVSANAEALIHSFTLKKEENRILPIEEQTTKSTDKEGNSDPAFEEVILLFKTKIDKQQVEIKRLSKDIEKCRAKLNYDTNLVAKSAEIEVRNKKLNSQLDSTSSALNKAKRRLEYLESFKENIESGSNGDLVLSLTSILSDVKKENNDLKSKLNLATNENEKLKKENQILLREVERLKYLINLREE